MSVKTLRNMAFLALAACMAVPTASLAESKGGEAAPVSAISKASKDVTMGFTRPGRVTDIYVKVGDEVAAGKTVAKQDDTEEQAAYDYAEAQANDKTRLEAQLKIRDQKEKVYQRKHESDAVSTTEKEEALLDWEVAKAQVALAEFEQTQDGLKRKQAEAVLNKTKLISQIDGIVAEVMIQAGENVDSQTMKVIRIVNVDLLWVDVPVPFVQALGIKVNATAHVKFTDKSSRDGQVIAISPVANSASETRMVRVAVPNPTRIPAGEQVTVTFSPDGTVAAKP